MEMETKGGVRIVYGCGFAWTKALITDVFEKVVSVAFPNEQAERKFGFERVRLPPSEHPRERNFCVGQEVEMKLGDNDDQKGWLRAVKQETLSGEELEAMLVKQMDIATCCVCLEPLSPTLVVCERGHGVCKPCALKLAECPICKQPFSPFKPILLTQLLETLPHECQHKGCSYFVRTGDDHEAWCGHIPAQCKKCDWIGDGESILGHIKEEHSSIHVFKEKNLCRLANFDPEINISYFLSFYVYGQFLWGECSIDLKKTCLNLKYHLVRNGKVPGDINVVVQMKNSTMHNTYRMKLCFDKKIKPKDNTISICLSALDGFVDNHNELCYEVDFIQEG